MTNTERVEQLETGLSKYLQKRRIISAILFAVFLIMGIIFSSIREATKEVVIHGEGFFSYETVTYNDYYVIGIVIGFLAATMIACVLATDIFCCRFKTIAANENYITVYRGMLKCSVYVNGEEQDPIGMFSLTNVVDTKLPDGTKISIAFSRSAFMIAHVSFSDNNPPVDL